MIDINNDRRFIELYNNDPVINQCIKAGLSEKEIIFKLVEIINEQTKRLLELQNISPKKIMVDGKCLVWRCPSEMIPLSETGFDLNKKKGTIENAIESDKD